MNKTKKLTTGAMLLAIIGTLMLIDRQLSYLFTELILLLIPVIISMYSTMYEFKDGLVLSVCLLILGVILGSVYSYFYVPLTIIVGLAYAYAISKDFNKKKLLLVAMGSYMIGEVLIMLVIQPLFGLSLVEQAEEIIVIMNETFSKAGMSEALEMANVDLKMIATTSIVIVPFVTGLMEGLLTHLISIILLKRFKIKDFTKGGLLTFELKPAVAYLCFMATFAFFFIPSINNETIKYIVFAGAIFGSLILVYYGYLFLVSYMKKRMPNNKRVAFLPMLLVLLFFPFSFYVLIICGFLLGAGPLKTVLDKMDLRIK